MPPPTHRRQSRTRPVAALGVAGGLLASLTLLLPTASSAAAAPYPPGSGNHHRASRASPSPTGPAARPTGTRPPRPNTTRTPAPAPATPRPTPPARIGTARPAGPRTLTITVPPALQLVAVPRHPRLFRGVLNGVTVTARGGAGTAVGWTATVTATGFRIWHGRHWTPVGGTRVSYTSAATAVADGLACRPAPARPGPAGLPSTQTAFACSGHSPLPTVSVSWNATITVTLTPDSLTGSYTGTITHSVS